MSAFNTPPTPFALTLGDINSPAFQRLKKYWEQELENARRENDADLDEAKTARLRGRIAELKRNLALENPVQQLDLPPGYSA